MVTAKTFIALMCYSQNISMGALLGVPLGRSDACFPQRASYLVSPTIFEVQLTVDLRNQTVRL
jgi:hypothetical protein